MKTPKNTCYAKGCLLLKRLASVLFFTLVITHLSSCYKCEPAVVQESILQITVIDSITGKNAYNKSSPLLNKDSIRVVDNKGNSVLFMVFELQTSQLPVEYYYGIFVYFIGHDREMVDKSFETEQCTSIRVYLTSSRFFDYNICYKSESGKCGTNLNSLSIESGGRNIPIEDRSYVKLIEKIRL
jgi:hypothetical protein